MHQHLNNGAKEYGGLASRITIASRTTPHIKLRKLYELITAKSKDSLKIAISYSRLLRERDREFCASSRRFRYHIVTIRPKSTMRIILVRYKSLFQSRGTQNGGESFNDSFTGQTLPHRTHKIPLVKSISYLDVLPSTITAAVNCTSL